MRTAAPGPDGIQPDRLDFERLAAIAGGTPFFVYDWASIERRIARLRDALPAGLGLRYAVKANPMPALVQHLATRVDGFDVASADEMRVAANASRAPADIAFAGPGKTDAELTAAVAAGVLVEAESPGEVDRLARAAVALGVPARLSLRLNTAGSATGAGMRMSGVTQFGMAAADAVAVLSHLDRAHLSFEGLHSYFGSQILDAAVLRRGFVETADVFLSLVAETGMVPTAVNLGGGFGIPYALGETPLDLAAAGAGLAEAVDRLHERLPETAVGIELGRYLVGEAGLYVARVVDRKTVGGETFVVVDGGLHHVLAATGNFGQRIRRNWPVGVSSTAGPRAAETQTIVGCNCTPLDCLARQADLPGCEPGDLVYIHQVGAYGASASPERFLSHPAARELVL